MEPNVQARPKNEIIAVEWVRKAFDRSSGLTVGQRIRKSIILLWDVASARWALRHCTSVGISPRLKGRMRVVNLGSMHIGDRFSVVSKWTPTELVTGPQGRIDVGDSVHVNFGVQIAAHERVVIGDRVMIGQHCIVSDTDFPELPSDDVPIRARPVEIGDDVWLAGRVTVRPGVKIGSGAVIIAGSVVETDIPAKVIAGGVPARPISKLGEHAVTVDTRTEIVRQPAALPAAPAPKLFGYLISDFTIDEFADELRTPDLFPGVGAAIAPYGQVTQTLMSPPPEQSDFAVVWTQPQTAIPSFAQVLSFEAVNDQILYAEVDELCALIEKAAQGYRFVFVPTWTLPSWVRGMGMLDSRSGGTTLALTAMNLRLMERLAKSPNVFVLNAARWFESIGPSGTNPKAWYIGKIAVARPVLAEAARDIRAALGALSGGPRKLLVLDLDDTLWGGIVGDVGRDGLQLGTLDGAGEAYVDFQRAIKDLKRRGIVLGIVSKNEESVAIDAIRNHPHMILREDDFVGWRINWFDKAQNILDLTKQLNLGLQSVVFIDDNPAERARVREALPEVYVPDWPKEAYLYTSALRSLRCFDAPALSREDLERTRMYDEESRREALRQQVGSIDEWLKTLDIQVTLAPISKATSARAAQLLNKTNQLNLTTRRLTETELLAWAERADHQFWVVNVADRLGEAGLTGLLGLEFHGDKATVVDFVLSCRVMGRKVEETMVHVAVAAAAARSARTVQARYIPTAKNKPCLSFWKASGFHNEADSVFTWDVDEPFALPDAITLNWQR
jgi:FkbH-like protein